MNTRCGFLDNEARQCMKKGTIPVNYNGEQEANPIPWVRVYLCEDHGDFERVRRRNLRSARAVLNVPK